MPQFRPFALKLTPKAVTLTIGQSLTCQSRRT